jgi:protein-disulfide isomerase
LALGVLLGPSAFQALAQPAAPLDPARLAPRLVDTDMVIGLESAPVTLIEYASLTCPHCASFQINTHPQLKANYIDTGLVKFIYRDFPLDRIALNMAMVARCAGPERYFSFIDVMFRQQEMITRGPRPEQMMEALRRLARQGGMSDATFDACLADMQLQNAVLAQRFAGERDFRVNSTPTIIINGRAYPGALSYDELDKILRPLVGRS